MCYHNFVNSNMRCFKPKNGKSKIIDDKSQISIELILEKVFLRIKPKIIKMINDTTVMDN